MELTCKRYKGEFITKDRWILDQISDKDDEWYWSGKGSFSLHLLSDYGITQEQYWNIIHGFDMNYHPTCSVCGTPVEFHRMSHGGWRKYCSRWCAGSSRETLKARFLAYGYEYAYLYMSKTDTELIKLGITGYGYRGTYRGVPLILERIILGTTDIEWLCDLEATLDLEFCLEYSEWLPKNKVIPMLRKVIQLSKGSSTTSLYDVHGNVYDHGNGSHDAWINSIIEDIV